MPRSEPLLVLLFCVFGATALASTPKFWPHFSGLRHVELLDGQWQYGLNLDERFDSMDPGFDPTPVRLTPNTTQVPSSMDASPPGRLGPRGVAMYRRTFTQRGRARLQFLACSFYCRVFVDGQDIGDHRAGGYVPWSIDVQAPTTAAPFQPATRELFVLADNRFNATTAPVHTGGDFWTFGGLMRSVALHAMPDELAPQPWPWRAYVSPIGLDKVNINVTLTDASFSGTLGFSLSFDGSSPVHGQANATQGALYLPALAVPDPRPWSLQDPQMHSVRVTIGNASVIERFGLRVWGVDNASSRITLNGKAVKLHGFNHHTQWPESGGIGASPTDAQLDADILLLKEAGANFIRGSHYPQDQRWLDRLDEAGIVMWEEAMGASATLENLTDWTVFMKYQLQQLDEMMDQSLNHPSIMTWAWFSEGPTDDERACPAYAACADQAQARDPSRFVTYASHVSDDKCLAHVSMISANYYPAWAWYAGGADHDLKAPAAHWNSWARDVSRQHPGKPFFISETGAGGIFEWSQNQTAATWTTKYQAEVIGADVDAALAIEHLSGVSVFQFFDIKVSDEKTRLCGPCDYLPGVDQPPTCGYIHAGPWDDYPDPPFPHASKCGRPGGLNHKGMLDPWRRKKEAYHVVAAKFNNASDLE